MSLCSNEKKLLIDNINQNNDASVNISSAVNRDVSGCQINKHTCAETTKESDPMYLSVRVAKPHDTSALAELMEASVRKLLIQHYSQPETESAFKYIFGIDRALIDEGNYHVVEINGMIVGSGGWSSRTTPCSDPGTSLTPMRPHSSADTATIRAIFVHPDYARQGIGRRLMQLNEWAARRSGFYRLELLATLTGVALYEKCGFTKFGVEYLSTPDGACLKAIKMEKRLIAFPDNVKLDPIQKSADRSFASEYRVF